MSRHNYAAIDGVDGEEDFEFTPSVHTRRTSFPALVKKRIAYVVVLVATVALVLVLAATKNGNSSMSQTKQTTLAEMPSPLANPAGNCQLH